MNKRDHRLSLGYFLICLYNLNKDYKKLLDLINNFNRYMSIDYIYLDTFNRVLTYYSFSNSSF